MITEIYNKGEIIANEGEAANSFFIIKKVINYYYHFLKGEISLWLKSQR